MDVTKDLSGSLWTLRHQGGQETEALTDKPVHKQEHKMRHTDIRKILNCAKGPYAELTLHQPVIF